MKFIPKEDIFVWKDFMRMFNTSTERGDHFCFSSIFPKDDPDYKLEMTRYRPRGYQYGKLDKKYHYTLHLIDYTYWKDNGLNAFVVLPGMPRYVKHPQVWIETWETYNKFSQMYARFKMEDIISFGKKWFHKHLNNIVSYEHKQNALNFKYYYPVSSSLTEFVILSSYIED